MPCTVAEEKEDDDDEEVINDLCLMTNSLSFCTSPHGGKRGRKTFAVDFRWCSLIIILFLTLWFGHLTKNDDSIFLNFPFGFLLVVVVLLLFLLLLPPLFHQRHILVLFLFRLQRTSRPILGAPEIFLSLQPRLSAQFRAHDGHGVLDAEPQQRIERYEEQLTTKPSAAAAGQ